MGGRGVHEFTHQYLVIIKNFADTPTVQAWIPSSMASLDVDPKDLQTVAVGSHAAFTVTNVNIPGHSRVVDIDREG